jgi:predicted nucleic-acid-binding Zn-ribbon protein
MTDFEEKILSLLEKINDKLDLLLRGSNPEIQIASSTSSPERTTRKPSEIIERQEEEEKAKDKPPIEGRRICPKCGSTNFNTEEDKSQVLFQQGGIKIFAKKYICRVCGTEV